MSRGLVLLAAFGGFVAPLGSASALGLAGSEAPLVRVSIGNVTVSEGDAGVVSATFTVALNQASSVPVSVAYATANDTATAPEDYQATGSVLQFAPGATSLPVTVPVNGDSVDETDERFFVNLSDPVNAEIQDGRGLGRITDDDGPAVSIGDVTVTEGDLGPVTASFAVSLSAPSPQPVSVLYATANGTANSPSDFVADTGDVVFSSGQTTRKVDITINGDLRDEPNETFFVALTSATNATIADAQGIGTILDDDGAPAFSVTDVTVTEGQSGTVNASFGMRLLPASVQTVSVDYVTADGTATAGNDYVAKAGKLAFSQGQTTKTVNVVVNGDQLDEIDETLTLSLSNPENAEIADGLGVGTIVDDDALPRLAIDDLFVNEGNAGTVDASFTVSLDGPSGRALSVDYATADGTASAPDDYLAIPATTLTFLPGQTSRTVTVKVNGETVLEPAETFVVNLSSPMNVVIDDEQGLGTIADDDALPPPPPPPPPPAPPPVQLPPSPRPPAQARRVRAALYAPPAGARLTGPPLLAWRAVPKARFYNVQLYRKGHKILSLWPYRPRLKLRRQWTYKGRLLHLRPGLYTWLVWPAFGPPARPHFGRMLGKSSFRIV